MFIKGPSDCDQSARVEDGTYDPTFYMKKHNLVIDHLRDENEWRSAQSEADLLKEKQVKFLLLITYFFTEQSNIVNNFIPLTCCLQVVLFSQENVSASTILHAASDASPKPPIEATHTEVVSLTLSEDNQGLAFVRGRHLRSPVSRHDPLMLLQSLASHCLFSIGESLIQTVTSHSISDSN